jgi:predicted DCC family thiol-disulfide oxidoreductase YuxK
LHDLGGIWKVLYGFIIIPRPIRDWVYDRIAKSRYSLFGKRDSCMIPTPSLKKRFL